MFFCDWSSSLFASIARSHSSTKLKKAESSYDAARLITFEWDRGTYECDSFEHSMNLWLFAFIVNEQVELAILRLLKTRTFASVVK